MEKVKIVIIDSDNKSVYQIQQLLNECRYKTKIIEVSSTLSGGIKLLRKVKPQIVFLEAELCTGTYMEELQKFRTYEFKTIITAQSDKYAYRAIKSGVFDYLLKPIADDDFARVLHKIEYEFLNQRFKSNEELLPYPPVTTIPIFNPSHIKHTNRLLMHNTRSHLQAIHKKTFIFSR